MFIHETSDTGVARKSAVAMAVAFVLTASLGALFTMHVYVRPSRPAARGFRVFGLPRPNRLAHLVADGQRLQAQARGLSTEAFIAGCVAWSREVGQALAKKPIALAKFRDAKPDYSGPAGITEGRLAEWGLLRGRTSALIEIETEAQGARRDWVGIAVALLVGMIGAWAVLSGWVGRAWSVVSSWLAG